MGKKKTATGPFGWDDPLPEELSLGWQGWKNAECLDTEMLPLAAIWSSYQSRITRIFRCKPVFLRLFSYKEDDSVLNVFGQAKVAPINPIRIPRLEPCGAVLAVQAVDSLRITKEIAMEISETVFYTDSKVALGYICNESRRFHIYVANRVQTIRKISSPNQWRYVESSVNPSDLATRGLDP